MTPAWMVLTRLSLRRNRGLLFALGLLLAGFQFLLTQVAAYLFRRGAFGQLAMLIPDFVRSVAGPSVVSFLSFSGVASAGYAHPIVLSALIGLTIALATEPAAEVERRFVDLTLAMPVPRSALITRTVAMVCVCDTALLAAMIAGTWVGVACCAPAGADHPSIVLIASQALALLAVLACWGGIALALAAGARRRAVAAAAVGGVAFAAYLLDYLGRAWEPARRISTLSPFHFFEPSALIQGAPLDMVNVATLFAIAVAGATAAYVVFARRDI